MAPSISHRESIAWPPAAPSEPTSTIVLTSAENRFVDTRIYHPSVDQEQSDSGVLPLSRLQWAFAGTSFSTPITDGVHSVWKHWVDSKCNISEVGKVVDEGDCFPLGDGRTVERGEMVDDEDGKFKGYEEVWVEGEVKGEKKCVVLVLDEEEKGRGMVVRVRDLCQGISKAEGVEGVTIERWEVDGGGKWTRTARIGDFFLPCGIAMESEKTVLGAEVVMGEMKWKVVELSDFE